MPGPCAGPPTIEPILPQPITPSVLPVISTPMKRFFSHLPACVEMSACGIWRASASISVIACSAVVIELPKGLFITMMPLAVAAGISTLSTPMPARPITFRFFAFSRIFGVTFVAERIARPSKSPMISASFSLSAPSFGWKSTSTPRSLKICTAAGERASEMRTRGAIGISINVSVSYRPLIPAKAGIQLLAAALGPRFRGDEQHLSRGLRQRRPRLRKRPVDPGRLLLHVRCLDGAAAPDAQTRRRIAVRGNVVARAFSFDQRDEFFHESPLRIDRQRGDRGIDDLQAHRSVRPRRRIFGQVRNPRRLL